MQTILNQRSDQELRLIEELKTNMNIPSSATSKERYSILGDQVSSIQIYESPSPLDLSFKSDFSLAAKGQDILDCLDNTIEHIRQFVSKSTSTKHFFSVSKKQLKKVNLESSLEIDARSLLNPQGEYPDMDGTHP